MPSGRPSPVARLLHRVAAARGGDGDLLRRFTRQADEAAFAELVRRHGPMVRGVCRRLLGDTPDADDAFQAAFLVLARKAGAVARPHQLANWLFGVARRTALRARAGAARRHAREGPLVDVPAPEAVPAVVWADLRSVLDEEVGCLPERYRAAFVLCHLQGRTTGEAAVVLGCPRGTVLSRLAWARQRLRARLTRRGVALPAAMLAGAVGPGAWAAPVPVALAGAVARAAVAFVAGGGAAGAVPAGPAALAERVSEAMAMKLRVAILVGTGVLAALAGVGAVAVGQDRPGGGVARPAAAAGQDAKGAGGGPGVTVASLPPVVVKTTPQAGDTEMDAANVTEVRVTFSKDMTDQSWSWSQISDETFPTMAGKPRYEADRRTCVLPVRLQPGRTYVVWLNSAKFGNFKDAGGQSAVPYLLVFQTKK
jgi:RNA polymerase sigma-70 factor (ECF subfamily)